MAGQKTKQAQSKLKYLGRIKRLPPPPPDDSGPTISVHSSGRSYAHVLSVEDVSVAYGSEPIVEEIEFDIYRGEQIEVGKKSLAYALTYQDADRTLTDSDVEKQRNKIIRALESQLKDVIRR